MIVDEAISDLSMEQDPFEKAGVPCPSKLLYTDKDKVTTHIFSKNIVSVWSQYDGGNIDK